MKFLQAAILSLLLTIAASAQVPMTGAGLGVPTVASGCSQATATIARLDGTQNAAHNTAYTTLICNLVTQGVWAKLDVFYIFATNDTANALTNLVSSSYAGTSHGSPSFSADAGYTGTDNSSTIYIDTGFNPSTAGGNYALNSSHVSMWSNTNSTSTTGGIAIGLNNGGTSNTQIRPKFSGNTTYDINNSSGDSSVAVTNSTGQFVVTRSGASSENAYHNASDQGITPVASGVLTNHNFFVLAYDYAGSPILGDNHQTMAITIGGSLTGTDVTNLCHETNSYLTAIGGIGNSC